MNYYSFRCKNGSAVRCKMPMFLNTYKIHRTHFCSSRQNTSYFLTPKTRKEKQKDMILGASIAGLSDVVFGLCICVTPCVILCTFAHI